MKLYAWQPRGHGPFSFFVMAESEEQARRSIELRLSRTRALGTPAEQINSEGWGTDDYELTVLDAGQVITNEND